MCESGQRQAGALFSAFLSCSLVRAGRVEPPLSGRIRECGDQIESDQKFHGVDPALIESERFEFDLIDGHWA